MEVRDKTLQLGERTLLVGVLNVTPDSFSDGGKYSDPDRAFAHAMELEEAGADIIDIGAESTRPGAARDFRGRGTAPPGPGAQATARQLTIPLSVDTYKAAIAERALDLGVDIINDPCAPHLGSRTGATWFQFNAA